jgi:hypothetical protein
MADEIDYGKYLEANPTQLMTHIEAWLKDKTGFDPKSARTKDEAFATGVYLTVHLRSIHQASSENQDRLAANRQAADAADAEKAEKRAERAAAGAKPRGRLPKSAAEVPAAEPAAPKRRGRAPKAKVTEVIPEVPAAEPAAPKRRGRTRKAAAETAEAPPENVTPIRRARAAKAATAAEPAAEVKKPVRRRPVRREGEAAF